MTGRQRHMLAGGPVVEIRTSARARRYSLRVPATGGPPVLTMPAGANPAEALRFAESRKGWLRRHLADRGAPVPVGYGTTLPVLGAQVTIAPGTGRSARRDGAVLHLPGPDHTVGKRAQSWLKSCAREALTDAATRYARSSGTRFSRLDLRDTKGRWGSCSSAGRLMFSWRLALAPPQVLDYVAAHEVAHLTHMDHSPRFWALVARICPGHEAPRLWLRENGPALHRFDFAAQTHDTPH